MGNLTYCLLYSLYVPALVQHIGEYADETRSDAQAEDKVISQRNDKEYLPITGLNTFTNAAATLAYGEGSKPLKEGRVSTDICPSLALLPRLIDL